MNFQTPLYASLPDTFEKYFEDCETDARTCHRKAIKNGASFKKIETLTTREHAQIGEIWYSTGIRQSRQMNLRYENIAKVNLEIKTDRWPVDDYSVFNCPNHNLDFFVCLIGGKIVAYLELLNSNNASIVHSTLGHAEYLKHGVMKYLFLETVKFKIPYLKSLIYGDRYSMKTPAFSFKKDLLIINADTNIVNEFIK